MRALLFILCLCLAAPFAVASSEPLVSAKSAIAIDARTGKVLWARDPDTPRYPASTTKVMTGLLMIEGLPDDEVIVAPEDVETVTGASLHLKPGEQLTAREMLYGVMLRSANDACYAVAIHMAGSVEAFAEKMNARAKEIGCTGTQFNNPHGLNDELHTTTARDLALIAREAMRNPKFAEVVGTREHTLVRSINQEDRLIRSKNRYMGLDPTADGIKTGFTRDAGQCYVGSVTRDEFQLITVLLDSEDWVADQTALVEWAFAEFDLGTDEKSGALAGEAQAVGARTPLTVALSEDVRLLDRPGLSPEVTIRLDEGVAAPIQQGETVGVAEFVDSDGFLWTVPVVAAADLARDPFTLAETSRFGLGHGILLVAALLIGTSAIRKWAIPPQ